MPHYDDFVLRQVNAFVGLVPSVSFMACSDQKYILNCQSLCLNWQEMVDFLVDVWEQEGLYE